MDVGSLVAIRTRQRDAHLVGRVVDAHQGIYLLQRHVRGTTTFDGTLVEVAVAGINDVVHADEDQPLSDAMERLWSVAAAWSSSTAEQPTPRPLTHRIERTV